jgi:hypothetical protein
MPAKTPRRTKKTHPFKVIVVLGETEFAALKSQAAESRRTLGHELAYRAFPKKKGATV